MAHSMKSNLDNFEAQFKRSTTSLIVLYLLNEKEMYAYDMIRETWERSGHVYKMPLLYTILNKLEDDGYVQRGKQVISDNNRVRVYYQITENGKTYLKELLTLYFRLSDSVKLVLGEDILHE